MAFPAVYHSLAPKNKELRMKLALILATLFALTACTPPAAPPPEKPQSASKEELGQMNRDFVAALNAKDAAAAAACYAENAVLIPPGEPMVRGRAAIEAYWKGFLEGGGVRDVSVETIDAKSSGDLGYEIGSFALTANGPDGEPVSESGRFIELLERGPDGKWSSTAGIWNASPPEP